MTQLELLKMLLGNPDIDDGVLQWCLDSASDIICDIRHSDTVEGQYLRLQVKIAIEIFNKMGAEGQVEHKEGDIVRKYEKGDISDSLIAKITPVVRTPFSTQRVIT